MTASMTATWHGPFHAELKIPAELLSGTQHVRLAPGGGIVVLAATASQMAASDSSWWTFT